MSNTPDLSALKGKSVLITGGASGLGLATALTFATAGAHVTVLDLKPPPASASHIPYIRTDVSSYASQLAAFKNVLANITSPTKHLDAVLLFAGIASHAGNLLDHALAPLPPGAVDPPQPSTRVLDVNLTGVYYGAYLALHYRVRSLVLVASMAAYVDYPGHTSYVVSKFGVRGLWRSLRAGRERMGKGEGEGGGKGGTRVNLVAPWYIDTPMSRALREKMLREGGVETGELHYGTVDDVVKAAGRFAMDEVLDGRVFGVVPDGDGNLDLGDDVEGQFAGPALCGYLDGHRDCGCNARFTY